MDNKESTTLIWFDPNIGIREDTEKTREELRIINDFVTFVVDIEDCVTFIRSIRKEKIFFITSGSRAAEVLSRIIFLPQLDSIFIFCMKKERYEHLLHKYPKIVGIYNDLDNLCQSIQEQIDLFNRQIQAFSFFDHHEKSTRDLSKESAAFLWFQLFNSVIGDLPRNEHAKQQMIHLCKEYYRGNRKELALIREFEQSYQSKDAIVWYSKQCFIYKLVNKALRTEDIDLLYRFRYYIGDLSKNLKQKHNELLSLGEEIINVYRGVKLDKEEFNRLKNNEAKLISFNGYLSTSRNKLQAINFALKSTTRTDVIPVLFHIQCDMKEINETIAFADIKKMSDHPKEEEVLFDLNACFRIESTEKKESLQTIKMSLSNEGKKITKDYLKLMKEETEELSPSIIFGRLLCNMGEYDKSEKYFEQLLNESNDEDPAWLEFNIGRALDFSGKWDEARQYYDRAYNRMMTSKPVRIRDSAWILNNIGVVLFSQGKYAESFDYHQQALKIREKVLPPGHADIAMSLNNIGNILHSQRKYAEALDYHQRALKIYQKFYPSGHVDIAMSLNNIGLVLNSQEKYDEALSYYQSALKIQEKFYPSEHPDIAICLSNIGSILSDQGKYEEALDYHQRALHIRKKIYPSGHSDIDASLNNIKKCS